MGWVAWSSSNKKQGRVGTGDISKTSNNGQGRVGMGDMVKSSNNRHDIVGRGNMVKSSSSNQRMFMKFKFGESELCTCRQTAQDTEHVLQSCAPLKELSLRTRIWPSNTSLAEKLYGTCRELCQTTYFIEALGLHI